MGERYYTYRLVTSRRVDGKPRQMTLLNLGRHFAVDQDLWASLCVRIEQLLSHQVELLPIELPAAVEKAAQRLAAQLIEQRAVVIKPPLADEGHSTPAESSIALVESIATEAAPADLQTVDVDSLELTRPRTVGVEQLGLWAMQQLKAVHPDKVTSANKVNWPATPARLLVARRLSGRHLPVFFIRHDLLLA